MGLFGFGKKKKKKTENSFSVPEKPSREALIAQAQANARMAREELGDETIRKIAAALHRKEQNPTEKAKAIIKAMDQGTVADHLKIMLEDAKRKK